MAFLPQKNVLHSFVFLFLLSSVPSIKSTNKSQLNSGDLKMVRLPCASQSQRCCLQFSVAGNTPNLACISLGYDQQKKTMRLNLKVDGSTLYDDDISIAETPAVCIPVPMVPFVKICGQLYDLVITPEDTQACLRVSLQLFNMDEAKLDLQCLNIPTSLITGS